MRARTIQFLFDPSNSWRDDQSLDDDIAKFLSARNLQAQIVASGGRDSLILWIEPMKKAATTSDPLKSVTQMFNRLRGEEWEPVKEHKKEQGK